MRDLRGRYSKGNAKVHTLARALSLTCFYNVSTTFFAPVQKVYYIKDHVITLYTQYRAGSQRNQVFVPFYDDAYANTYALSQQDHQIV